MKTAFAFAAALLTAVSCSTPGPMEPVGFENVKIEDSFWSPRLRKHKDVTMDVCIDQIENRTGRIRNFENAALGEGTHSGIYFDDSDVYKALEGFAYSLQNNPDPELEAKCDEWIDKFAAAQQPDGYINTYYTLTGLQNRWTDMGMHEMYCAGHMIEAAVAYYNVTGKRKMLDICEKMVAHMMDVFGPGKRDWVTGHEEIELALVKLWRTTGNDAYLQFAEWLLDERGHGYGSHGDGRAWVPQYSQDDVPVRDMRSITGHAVRSMYLYCAMADIASVKGDAGLTQALDSLWDDVVLRNMYVTGGIGQSRSNEGFTADYSLPNATAYCETCASVGMVLWNSRMNRMKGDAKYADVLERSLYNGALAGISLEGDRFFYVNPLESDGNHHRKDWYGCACCPSQLCRFLPSIGGYIYAASDEAVWVNLFIGNTAGIETGGRKITLSQETRYPWDGDVAITLGTEKPLNRELRVRIPGWCRQWSISVNGTDTKCRMDKGYAVLSRRWADGDKVTLHMDMPVEVVAADSRVREDEGMRAVMRGPLVYCMEETDNAGLYDDAVISAGQEFSTSYEDGLLGGIVTISSADSLRFIPYYCWDNREPSRMKVWVNTNDMKKTLVIVDVQRDFFHPQGHLYVAGGEVLPERIASVIPGYESVVLTMDWHPGDHCSFTEHGGTWPSHCVAYTQGAGLPDEFAAPLARGGVYYFHKGCDVGKEQYGAFEGMQADDDIFKVFDAAERIDVCGIAGDYCVKETIANIIGLGFKDKVVVLKELVASIDGGATLDGFIEDNGLRAE